MNSVDYYRSQRNVALLREQIELPTSAFERADQRYRDLGVFFGSARAKCSKHSPHIFAQGSFRLGTVVRPLAIEDDYDLDVGCRLRGLTKSSLSQAELKKLVGEDLATYRLENNISQRLEEKRRCWRLRYRDQLGFHMDVVPSIPEGVLPAFLIQERMQSSGIDSALAGQVAKHAGAITDNELASYRVISHAWHSSNSEGFALWFESRMRQARLLLEQNALRAGTTIDRLPARRWDSPLQAAIRILKHHRDHMFRTTKDSKPISVILTTLAARSYGGETDLQSALSTIVERMESHIRPTVPRVPNPVNPIEDFADKWPSPTHAHLNLELSVRQWIQRARQDFTRVTTAASVPMLEHALEQFGVSAPSARMTKAIFG